MEFCQATRVIESDACSPVDEGLGLVIQLVEALEHILQLFLWNAFSRVGHCDLHLIVDHIEADVDMSASGSELQGVRQQVGEDLLQFVGIGPRHEGVLQAKAVEGETLFLGIELEGVEDVVHGLYHVDLLHTQAQGVVLQFIEVHQLVNEFEHALDAFLGDAEQPLVLIGEVSALYQLAYGSCNHRQRCAELMGDIGEEAHVHLVGAQLLFFLHLSLTGSTAGVNQTTGIAIEIPDEGRGQSQIDDPSPPRIGRGRFDHHADGALVIVEFVAGSVGGAQAEGIVA